jgi:methyl-accepting chemotaxis protein
MKNWKIGARLGLGFAVVLFLLIAIDGIAIWRLQVVADSTKQLLQGPFVTRQLVNDWNYNVAVGIQRATAIARSSDTSLVQFFAASTTELTQQSQQLQEKVGASMNTPEEREAFNQIAKARAKFVEYKFAVIKAKAASNVDQANQIFQQQFLPATKDLEDAMRRMLMLQRTKSNEIAAKVEAINSESRTLLLVLGVLVLALGASCAWWLTIGMTRPLREALKVAHAVASGDLTSHIQVKSTDETGELLQALNRMNQNLEQMVNQVRSSSTAIATSTQQLATGNIDLAQRSEEQAASLEETAASMEELTATVKQNADNAERAASLATTASSVAKRGGDVVNRVVSTMQAISDSSGKVADIVSVIESIAFQTNILALNAAVEAARAGDHGRGFAVVAAEVRTLAKRSADSAKEIKGLIEESVGRVDAGVQQVGEAGTTITEVMRSVAQVTEIMEEISSASREQSAGIEQVGRAVEQMDQATQQNAALVEQSTAAAQSMSDRARELEQAVSVFKL